MAERIDNFALNPFLDGPSEFLVKVLQQELLKIPQWKTIFGDSIDRYKRMDYSIRQLPALRIYNDRYTKQYESWFEVGDLTLDVIYPASIRREETQQLQDTISAALIQQFRSHDFFNAVCAGVPGLNELGKVVNVDKSLGFEWGEDIVPLTQVSINFRIDLRQWDVYLESQGRTLDQPFVMTLKDLKSIVGQIEAMRDDNTVELTIESDQTV